MVRYPVQSHHFGWLSLSVQALLDSGWEQSLEPDWVVLSGLEQEWMLDSDSGLALEEELNLLQQHRARYYKYQESPNR